MSAEAFWAAWLGEMPQEEQDRDAASRTLLSAAERAAIAYPGVDLDVGTYLAHVAARLEGTDAVDRTHLEDLWIACAALEGSNAAVEAFNASFGTALAGAVRRVCSDASAVDEICQVLCERLLVARDDQPGDLSTYAGRSALKSWLAVVAFREAARHVKAAGAQPAESDLFVAAEAGANPELVAIKREHADAFREAFEGAIAGLSRRERAALRFHLVEGLSIDRIAALESIHRATAARWVAGARAKIYDSVRAELRSRMKLTRGELESLIRVVRSQLDFSVKRHLVSGR